MSPSLIDQPKQPHLLPCKSLNVKPKLTSNLNPENEFVSTPEKKAKYNAMAKDLATKLAFKNLKSQLFKFHEAKQGGSNDGGSTKHSSNTQSGHSSEGEVTATSAITLSILNDKPGVIKQATIANEGDRSLVYLTSFDKIYTGWDKTCLSDHLELRPSIQQICMEQLDEGDGRICRAINQEHCFKSAFGTEALLPGHRYYFEIKCVKGTNFKIGIATES